MTGRSNFEDVGDFGRKFGLPTSDDGAGPIPCDDETIQYRVRFMQEELNEFVDAFLAGDIAEEFDALLDLVYVAMGTAHFLGLPWQAGWDEVQRANMAKVRTPSSDVSKRGSAWDVVKPEGWTAPDIAGVLRAHGWTIPTPEDQGGV